MSTVAPSASSSFLGTPLAEFIELVGRKEAAPGGGSVAAIAISMAAALVEMAARFSEGWEDARGVAVQAKTLRERTLPLARTDALVYAEALAAMRLPKEGRPEVRDHTIGRALFRAAEVPLAIAEAGTDVAILAAEVAEHGNPSVRGDAAAGAALAEGATRAAANLVAINLATGSDVERVLRAQKLVTAASEAAARAFAERP